MTLDELSPRERAVITDAADLADAAGGGVMRRMMELGIVRGTGVRVIRRAPAGDPVEVELRGYRLTLRRSLAKKITVARRGGVVR